MKIRRALIALALCLSLSACSTKPVPMQTMEEFLAETNQKHAAVVREEVDPTPYLRKPIEKEDPEPASVPRQTTIDHSVESVSRQQALEDVEYLFQAFRSTYALYDYFGGDEVFNNAKEACISDINQYPSEQITPDELSPSSATIWALSRTATFH